MNAECHRGPARNEQALRLWRRMQDCQADQDGKGWQEARASLFEMFVALGKRYGKHYLAAHRLPPEDIEQECHLATLQAIDQWDPSRGELPVILNYCVRLRLYRAAMAAEMIRRPPSVYAQWWQDTCHGEASPCGEVRVLPLTLFERRGSPTQGEPYDPMDTLSFRQYDPAEQERIDLKISVEQALDRIPDEQRKAVVLHYGLQGNSPHSLREIAPLLGVSYMTVANRIKRAQPVLRQALEGYA